MIELVNKEILKYLNKKNTLNNFDIENDRIDEYLLNNNLITEEELLLVYKSLFNMEIIDLNMININNDIIKLLTYDFINKYKVIPIKLINDLLYIGITDPFDIFTLEKVKIILKDYKIKFVLCSKTKLLKLNWQVNSTVSRKTLVEESNVLKNNDEVIEINNITSSYIVKLVDSIIQEAICLQASDIHLEPFQEEVIIRYRIDGSLIKKTSVLKDVYKNIVSRIKILSNLDISKTLIPQDGRITYLYNNNEYDLRVSCIPVINGERIVLRILDTNEFNYTIDNIGFNKQDLEYIKKVINLPFGIILLTGPTGSGKSTTLYVFLKELLKKDLNIITVEDPVEYNIEGINQIGVNNKTNMTFEVGLRSILRQDPNVIMIGEIRDEETAEIAVRASITGHLVFSTLHTNKASSTITRLIDMKIKPYFLSDSLTCIINQRLVKKLCPHCKKKLVVNNKQFIEAYFPVGCPACNNTGYKGRIMVYEILKVTNDVKEFIAKGATTLEIQKLIEEKGFRSITDNTKELVIEGITSIEEFNKIKYDLDE